MSLEAFGVRVSSGTSVKGLWILTPGSVVDASRTPRAWSYEEAVEVLRLSRRLFDEMTFCLEKVVTTP